MIQLRKIDYDNFREILSLRVKPEQSSFVADNGYSLAEAFALRESGHRALPFGLYHQGQAVGFAMLGYGYIDGDPQIARGNYLICRLMIAAEYQGRGLGKAALAACLDYIRTGPCGPGEYVWLSYEPENTAARNLYHRAGFHENGEVCGGETVAVLKL